MCLESCLRTSFPFSGPYFSSSFSRRGVFPLWHVTGTRLTISILLYPIYIPSSAVIIDMCICGYGSAEMPKEGAEKIKI